MTGLLELKERVIRFCGRYESFLLPVVKFILGLTSFLLINLNIGYMRQLSGVIVAPVLAVLCAVLPANAIILFSALLITGHLYALSLDVCLVWLILAMLILLLYFRFAPKDGYYAVLTPVLFKLHIPYIMPVTAGLLRTPASAASVASGTIVYYFLKGIRENEAILSAVDEEEEKTSKMVVAFNQLLTNKEMFLVLATFVLVLVVVNLIRRLSIDHSWLVAIIAGILVELTVLVSGFMILGITGKMLWLIVGSVISLLIALAEQFLFFNLDYSRTEHVQFEDDEYYYYVKAVPKNSVTTKNKQVKKIAAKEDAHKGERISRRALAEEMDIDEELLK